MSTASLENREQKEVPTNLAQTGKEYSVSVLKGLIGAVPYVGALFNEVLFEARSRLKQQRLEAFFQEIADDVGKLSESKIDREYLKSEEFSDLFEDVANKVSQTRDDRKRAYFKSVLLKGIEGRRAPVFSSAFLGLLHELTIEELDVLSLFVAALPRLKELRTQGGKPEMHTIDYNQPTIGSYPSEDYRLLIQSLIRKGLVFDDGHGFYDSVPFTRIEATDLGANFHKWVAE